MTGGGVVALLKALWIWKEHLYRSFQSWTKCCLRISACCSRSKKLDGANQRPRSDRHQHWFCSSGIGGTSILLYPKLSVFTRDSILKTKSLSNPNPTGGQSIEDIEDGTIISDRNDRNLQNPSDLEVYAQTVEAWSEAWSSELGAKPSDRRYLRFSAAPGVTLLLTRRSARRGTSKAKAAFWGHSNCDPGLDFFQS